MSLRFRGTGPHLDDRDLLRRFLRAQRKMHVAFFVCMLDCRMTDDLRLQIFGRLLLAPSGRAIVWCSHWMSPIRVRASHSVQVVPPAARRTMRLKKAHVVQLGASWECPTAAEFSGDDCSWFQCCYLEPPSSQRRKPVRPFQH